jgi:hypothetical protein
MDEKNSDFETESARRASTAATGTPTTYIPPEVRPDPQPQVPYSGAPTQPQPEAPRWTQPQSSGYSQASPPAAAEQPVRTYGGAWAQGQRRHGPPIVGPILLIGAGVLFLLNNLGIVDWGIWNDLWRLWPLILIAIGLDLLVGRRNPLLSLVIVLLVLGAGAAVVASTGGFRGAGTIASTGLSVPLGSAKSAVVEIDHGAGNLNVDGNGENGMLAVGTLEFWQNHGTPRQDVSTSGDKVTLKLDERSEGFFNLFGGSTGNVDWDIHLSPNVPLAIEADLGAGNSDLDLSRLNVTALDIKAGAGNTTVSLPEKSGRISATVDGGVGNITLEVPQGIEARINVDTGLGNVTADSRFTKQGDTYVTAGYDSASERADIDLKVGVGNVVVKP